MKPLFHPQLVNGTEGDPALFVDFLFERRALLFDLGDLHALAPRKMLRLSHVFVSHTHMDHFIGFDALLRVCLGRQTEIHLFGPPGFTNQVQAHLGGYSWNLVENYDTDFTILTTEISEDFTTRNARFRCRTRFAREDRAPGSVRDGILLEEDAFCVRCTVLDHRIPCLAFALEEKQHVNVWKNRLAELELPTGPWLQQLKRAVAQDQPDDTEIVARWRDNGAEQTRRFALGDLKQQILSIEAGQKIAYVVDTRYTDANAARIIDLVREADLLFIEAAFLDADRERAAQTHHLTATQAGQLAARAGVGTLIPFHFSTRYPDSSLVAQQAHQAFAAARIGA